MRLAELSRGKMKVWGMDQSDVCWKGGAWVLGMRKAVENGGVPCLARAVLCVLWGVEEERGKYVDERCKTKKGEVDEVIGVLLDFTKHWSWLVCEMVQVDRWYRDGIKIPLQDRNSRTGSRQLPRVVLKNDVVCGRRGCRGGSLLLLMDVS